MSNDKIPKISSKHLDEATKIVKLWLDMGEPVSCINNFAEGYCRSSIYSQAEVAAAIHAAFEEAYGKTPEEYAASIEPPKQSNVVYPRFPKKNPLEFFKG